MKTYIAFRLLELRAELVATDPFDAKRVIEIESRIDELEKLLEVEDD